MEVVGFLGLPVDLKKPSYNQPPKGQIQDCGQHHDDANCEFVAPFKLKEGGLLLQLTFGSNQSSCKWNSHAPSFSLFVEILLLLAVISSVTSFLSLINDELPITLSINKKCNANSNKRVWVHRRGLREFETTLLPILSISSAPAISVGRASVAKSDRLTG